MTSPVQTLNKDFVLNISLLPDEHARRIVVITTYGSQKTLRNRSLNNVAN